jgi:hypothetical protein
MLLWWDLSVDVNKHLFIREPNFIIYINSYLHLKTSMILAEFLFDKKWVL